MPDLLNLLEPVPDELPAAPAADAARPAADAALPTEVTPTWTRRGDELDALKARCADLEEEKEVMRRRCEDLESRVEALESRAEEDEPWQDLENDLAERLQDIAERLRALERPWEQWR